MLLQATPAPAPSLEQLQQQVIEVTTHIAEMRAQVVILDRQIRRAGDNLERAQLIQQRTALNAQIDAANAELRVLHAQIDARVSQGEQVINVPPVPPLPPVHTGPQWDPDMIVALGGAVIVFIFFPLTVAFARRLWRGKPAAPISPAVNEMPSRLDRLEQAVDTIAIEIERISENQRFLTKLMAERQAPAIGAGPIEPVQVGDREKERVK